MTPHDPAWLCQLQQIIVTDEAERRRRAGALLCAGHGRAAVLFAVYPPSDPSVRMRRRLQSMTTAQILADLRALITRMTPHDPAWLCQPQQIIVTDEAERCAHAQRTAERLRALARVQWP